VSYGREGRTAEKVCAGTGRNDLADRKNFHRDQDKNHTTPERKRNIGYPETEELKKVTSKCKIRHRVAEKEIGREI